MASIDDRRCLSISAEVSQIQEDKKMANSCKIFEKIASEISKKIAPLLTSEGESPLGGRSAADEQSVSQHTL